MTYNLMNPSARFFLSLILFLSVSSMTFGETRTWRDASGRFSVEADFISQKGDKVTLRRSDGKKITLPVAKLSTEDQTYLQEKTENPFENAVEEEDNGSETDKNGGRASFRIEEIGESIPLGDRSEEEPVSSGGLPPEWGYRPETNRGTAKSPAIIRPIPLFTAPSFKDDPSIQQGDLFFANNESRRAFVPFSTGLLDDARHYLEVCQLDDGTTTLYEFPFHVLCFGPSPDESKILVIRQYKPAGGGFDTKRILCVLRIDGKKFVTENEFLPYLEPPQKERKRFRLAKEGDFENACWVDDRHVMTYEHGALTEWDIETGKSIRTFSGEWGTLSFSPDRKAFVLAGNGGINLYETESGRLLGVLAGDPREVLGTEFSPSGALLAVLFRSSLTTYDLKDGKVRDEIPMTAILHKKPLWTNEENILVGSILYHLDKKLPLCQYGPILRPDALRYHGGAIWLTSVSSFPRQTELMNVVLPHFDVNKRLKNLKLTDDFWLYPGAKIQVKFDLNGLIDEKQARDILKERLKERKFDVNPNAAATLTIRYADTGEEREVSYRQGGSGFPRLPAVPLLFDRSGGDLGSMKLKVFSMEAVIDVGGNEVWSLKRLTSGPQTVEYNPDQKVEETLRENNKPSIDFIKFIPLPDYVSKSEDGADALFRGTITSQGVEEEPDREDGLR